MGLNTMEKQDIITLSELERIAAKVDSIARPLDFDACELPLDEHEWRIVRAMEKVGRLALHNDFKRVHNKINNHHHVTLNVVDGITFRENGSKVPAKSSAYEDGACVKG